MEARQFEGLGQHEGVAQQQPAAAVLAWRLVGNSRCIVRDIFLPLCCEREGQLHCESPSFRVRTLVGTFSSKRMFEVKISWMSDDVDETIGCAYDPKSRKSQLLGKTSQGVKLTGKRLLRKSQFE